ncbi:lipoprotein-releasing system ATP-binding protein [Cyclonatronum proteinivorum]|uniref:Lipoprotein-releasing system ATP-binding protein n=1 Tax=Cyclonatronum proteinivorum TaxID=1457365 RepID=A0A345UKK7_9BACT|nr:ABC transporter ATP-binding protein [Cyclonatronum proteinivorum]AXJ01009.1 lipoprotein-releasing system ATP-binding protein [Cyclonatronum proteinivorum]
MEPILYARDLKKSYEEKGSGEKLEVLKGVNIDIAANEIVAIVGASGSGKSTLLHLLGGLDRADSGDVFFRGTNMSTLNTAALAGFRNKNMGFVFQFHHLLPEFSALENVMMPALIGNHFAEKRNERAEMLLGQFGLAKRGHHRPSELSGGEQQRVAVARALMNEPDLLLADEPTGNLDEHNTQTLLDQLFELRNALSITVVMVTHDRKIASRCDRVLRIEQGNIVAGEMNF